MRKIIQVLRWTLAAVVAFYLVVFAGDLLTFEADYPELRQGATEAAGFEAAPAVLYSAVRDSLGVRLAERAQETTSAERLTVLNAEIVDWQTRLARVVRYRDVSAVASRYRLYGWTAVAVLTLLLLGLTAGPWARRRLDLAMRSGG